VNCRGPQAGQFTTVLPAPRLCSAACLFSRSFLEQQIVERCSYRWEFCPQREWSSRLPPPQGLSPSRLLTSLPGGQLQPPARAWKFLETNAAVQPSVVWWRCVRRFWKGVAGRRDEHLPAFKGPDCAGPPGRRLCPGRRPSMHPRRRGARWPSQAGFKKGICRGNCTPAAQAGRLQVGGAEGRSRLNTRRKRRLSRQGRRRPGAGRSRTLRKWLE